MSYAAADLTAEIVAIVEARIDRGQRTEASWITHAIMKAHPGIKGDDSDFYTLCAWEHVRSEVRRAVQRYRITEEEPDRQLVLPGMVRLQRAYLVTQDKKQVVVPLPDLTTEEIESKIAELLSMAAGCQKHADELRRYAEDRAA